MAEQSHIEWTDATWNPIAGCSVVSPGCTNCYAMRRVAPRLSANPATPHYAGTVKSSKGGPVWTGKIGIAADAAFMKPLTWRRPRMIFVNSTSDLFHEGVPDEVIDRIFAVMALCPQHTFQVLTKRSARMRQYIGNIPNRDDLIAAEAVRISDGSKSSFELMRRLRGGLPNLWLGVSVEDQARANERIPDLLATPAAIRFVSAEPLLGPVNLRRIRIAPDHHTIVDALDGYAVADSISESGRERPMLDWVIVGGESGPGARPMHPAWARSLRDQCAAAGTPFFFKQWGEWMPTSSIDVYCHGPGHNERQFPDCEGIAWLKDGRVCLRDFTVAEHARRMRSGEASTSRAIEIDHAASRDFHASMDDPNRRQDNPLGLQWMYRVGKHRAGRELDGVVHDARPVVRTDEFRPTTDEAPHA